MNLDVTTLMIASAFVSLVSGTLLVVAWLHYRESQAALWWAGANVALAAAIVLVALGSVVAGDAIYFMGMTLLCVSSAFTWAGARAFQRHRIMPVHMLAGPALWLAVLGLSLAFSDTRMLVPINATITLGYYASAAHGIYFARDEFLRARRPLSVLIAIHAVTLMLAVPASLSGALTGPPPPFSWFGIIHFESMVFTVGTAIFLVAIMNERAQRRFATAALTDPLTGLLNRRGFLQRAERVLDRARRNSTVVAVIVFDLDGFKQVNDSFGHATGDRVLEIYAEVTRKVLRPADVVGRLGGEEFAALLPGFDPAAALAMGERVRKAFALAAVDVDGRPVNATLSGGVASATNPDDIHQMLMAADRGLYLAKDRGRNRIEHFEAGADGGRKSKVVRIA
ncbi:MAG: GGDEF domain-containing protein [Mesorhizobium sp.]|nr:GGDEF domain-containing protein [Mesorhizobium sp.]